MNKLLADEALTTLSHHLWYLAPNNTLFSLAGKKLEDRMMKSAALQTSCICQNQNLIKFGYLDSLKLSDENELQDLMQVFEILTGWPPAEWDTNPDYIIFQIFVRTVKVTNNRERS